MKQIIFHYNLLFKKVPNIPPSTDKKPKIAITPKKARLPLVTPTTIPRITPTRPPFTIPFLNLRLPPMYEDIKPEIIARNIDIIPKAIKRLYGISSTFCGIFVPKIARTPIKVPVKRNPNPAATPSQLILPLIFWLYPFVGTLANSLSQMEHLVESLIFSAPQLVHVIFELFEGV